jgi:hypothetical protein
LLVSAGIEELFEYRLDGVLAGAVIPRNNAHRRPYATRSDA